MAMTDREHVWRLNSLISLRKAFVAERNKLRLVLETDDNPSVEKEYKRLAWAIGRTDEIVAHTWMWALDEKDVWH